jgi:hypothetical protein
MNRRRRGQAPAAAADYVYPFPSSQTTVNRIDQGQDFGGSGGIRAIGRAQIIQTHSPWPEYSGGAGILYKLLEGKYAGRLVYVYEGVQAKVRPGQVVSAGQTIGQIIPGTSSGIETGWADPSGQPVSAAEYTEGKETRAGKAFASFLKTLPKAGPHGGYPTHFKNKAEEEKIKEIAKKENLGEGVFPTPGDVASELLSGIFGAIHPEALMLNIGLVGGGAFLVYYGAALMLGVKRPVAGPAAGLAATKGAPA